MEEGGFTVVSKRKGRQRAAPFKITTNTAEDAPAEIAVEAIRGRVQTAFQEILISRFWEESKQLLSEVPPFQSLVCLGIGNFSTSVNARYQLAFSMLLAEVIYGERQFPDTEGSGTGGDRLVPTRQGAAPVLFDPVFSETEVQYARALGWDVPSENVAGRVNVVGRTLFFMPHCGHQLYSNVLSANWNAESLAQTAILGNSFLGYAEMLTDSRRELVSQWSRVIRATAFVHEVPCAANEEVFSHAFNNLSFNTFGLLALPDVESPEWYEFTEAPEDDPLACADVV